MLCRQLSVLNYNITFGFGVQQIVGPGDCFSIQHLYCTELELVEIYGRDLTRLSKTARIMRVTRLCVVI